MNRPCDLECEMLAGMRYSLKGSCGEIFTFGCSQELTRDDVERESRGRFCPDFKEQAVALFGKGGPRWLPGPDGKRRPAYFPYFGLGKSPKSQVEDE